MTRHIAVAVLCVGALSLPAAAADLKLEIRDGKVTLVAHDVQARQILSEWAKLGQTQIVNADKLPSTMLTLQFEGVPEARALEIILRGGSGYMAATRATAIAGGSIYDRILIMPPSTAVAANTAPRPMSSPVQAPPVFRPPNFRDVEAPDDQDPPVPVPTPNNPMSALTPGMPGYIAPPNVTPAGAVPPYPGAPMMIPGQQQPPPQQASPQNPWGVTAPGSTAPGVITPPTVQPGVINPLVPRRPGGGQ